jgi:phosphate transport system substrate-binding protein
VVFLAYSKAYAEQLIIPGTGACEILLKELAKEFNAEHPEHEVVIPPSVGSTGGIRQVWEGEAELGRVARDFKKHELNYSLKRLVFARDMVVFVVGSKVGVTNLSAQQLADVFSGKIENWKQVGGNDYLPTKG